MTGLIYTAVAGNYDKLRPVKVREPDIDYVVFTDGQGVAGWEKKKLPIVGDARMNARHIKVTTPTNLEKEYDWTLWVDGNMEIKSPITKMVPKWLETHSFAAFKHPWWQCLYTEIDKCRARGKDKPERLEAARKYLKEQEFPRNYGQLATWVLLRKQNDVVKQHAKLWWADMKKYTMRDQVTFMLNTWRLGVGVAWIPGIYTSLDWYKNDWFQFHAGHRR